MKQLINSAVGIGAGLLITHGCRQVIAYQKSVSNSKAFATEICRIMQQENKDPGQAMRTLLARDGRDNPKWAYSKNYKQQAAQALRDQFLICSGYDLKDSLIRKGYL